MARRLQWPQDGAGWPLAEAAQRIEVGAQRWFVQRCGRGPALLLLHGTGASAHSWRGLVPLLQPHFELLVPDLPGHAFSSLPAAPGRAAADDHRARPESGPMTLPGIAAALGALLRALRLSPALVVGHSAGVAIALQLCLDGLAAPAAVLGFNPALKPFGGAAGSLFAPLARLLAAAPGVPELFAWRAASPAALRRLIDGTGSRLDAEGVALYARLVRNPGHVEGALAMMANWQLQPLWDALPQLPVPLRLVVGRDDRTVPPRQAREALQRLPPGARAGLVEWPGLGHLAHEEQPRRAAEQVLALARERGVLRA